MQHATAPNTASNVNIPTPSLTKTPFPTQQSWQTPVPATQQSWQTPMNPITNTQNAPPQNYVQPGGTGPGSNIPNYQPYSLGDSFGGGDEGGNEGGNTGW